MIARGGLPIIPGADANDLGQCPMVDGGTDVLHVGLAQVDKDMAQRHGDVRREVGVRV